jgi:hypothetical protein
VSMARSIYTRQRGEAPQDWAQRLIDSTEGMPRESMKRICRLALASAIGVQAAANDA